MCRSDFYRNLEVLGIYFPVTQKNLQLISGSALHMSEVTFTLYILVSQVHDFSSAVLETSRFLLLKILHMCIKTQHQNLNPDAASPITVHLRNLS